MTVVCICVATNWANRKSTLLVKVRYFYEEAINAKFARTLSNVNIFAFRKKVTVSALLRNVSECVLSKILMKKNPAEKHWLKSKQHLKFVTKIKFAGLKWKAIYSIERWTYMRESTSHCHYCRRQESHDASWLCLHYRIIVIFCLLMFKRVLLITACICVVIVYAWAWMRGWNASCGPARAPSGHIKWESKAADRWYYSNARVSPLARLLGDV